MIMLEASDQYFAYQPILKAIQSSNEAALPFGDLLKYTVSAQVHSVPLLSPFASIVVKAVESTPLQSCVASR
jgi:hypothetical protein